MRLCTFSGKNGDIVTSLPTARALAERDGSPVDFGIMPQYEKLGPLIQAQEYIRNAFVIDNWITTGSPFGDQPWEAPINIGCVFYDVVSHLTYREHPKIPLIRYISQLQGVDLGPYRPWLKFPPVDYILPNEVMCGFNPDHSQEKLVFMDQLRTLLPELNFIDVSKDGTVDWTVAAACIQTAGIFVGDRSALAVVGYGVGAKVLTFEPNMSRSQFGQGHQFGPDGYGTEFGVRTPDEAAKIISSLR
jgi:hypothetical protein